MHMFEFEGLDELSDTMIMVSKAYPKGIKKFMQSEGNKLKNKTLKIAKSSVGVKTGNFLKGIKRGKYYKYVENGADSIRVYAGGQAMHSHLIEYGHEMITPKTRKGKKLNNGGKSVGRGFRLPYF